MRTHLNPSRLSGGETATTLLTLGGVAAMFISRRLLLEEGAQHSDEARRNLNMLYMGGAAGALLGGLSLYGFFKTQPAIGVAA